MTTQQQIDACEQELASLLSRVLESTLHPIKEGLKSLEQQQADLREQIETLDSTSQQVSGDLKDTQQELKRLRSKGDEAQRETIIQVTTLLADSQTSLLNAQEKAQTDTCASLGVRLAGHTTERTEWLAQSLGSAVSQGTLQQQQSAEDLRENLLHRLTALELGGEAIDQKVVDLTLRLEQLHQTLLQLQQDGQTMQNTTTRGQRELTVLCEASAQRAEASIDKALRSIRYLLTAVLVMALGGTLLAAYGQWGTVLK
jgi:chromosome segregation ATPase